MKRIQGERNDAQRNRDLRREIDDLGNPFKRPKTSTTPTRRIIDSDEESDVHDSEDLYDETRFEADEQDLHASEEEPRFFDDLSFVDSMDEDK